MQEIATITPEAVLEKMKQIFGEEKFANPDIYPKLFQYQVKLAKWLLHLEALDSSKNSDLTVPPES